MLLECTNLTKFYGRFLALDKVSVSIQPGCVGLLGPNGAGKSTLIRTLLGLLDFQAGSAKVLGFDISRQLMEVRQRIGYMPELECTFPGLTGLDMVAYAGELSGLPRHEAISRAHEVLDYVGLGEQRYRDVSTFSTGMKQRTKLAQALVHGPELVLLDEPTNGLDPLGREEMLAIIANLAEAGVNVLLSSHLLHDVERVCDSIILMNEGSVLHYGTLGDFLHSTFRRLEVEVRGGDGPGGFAEALRRAGLEVTDATERQRLIQVTLQDEEDVDLIWRVAVRGEYEVRHLAPAKVSLETAFIHYMEEKGRLSEEVA